jgi:two-component system sensor histidine kinase PhoQ
MARTNHSLRGRLLLSASLVLLVFLGLMGGVLDQAFQRSAEQGVSERLLLHIYGLLTATDESEGSLFLPEALQEPEFNRLGTGLYGMVIDRNGKELWRSASALDLALPPPSKVRLYTNLSAGVPSFGYVTNNVGDRLFYLSYRVLWQGANEQTTPYTFAVLQTMDAYEGEIRGFRNNLWGWLVGVVVVLIAVQAVVMNWGLSPLKELARDLKQIEDGDKDFPEGDYPAEIDGVTRNLNLLLSSEREQREKYRTTLADLAHSLKTPLAILKGAASSLTYAKKAEEIEDVRETVDEQVGRMNEIVAYQLERAVAT